MDTTHITLASGQYELRYTTEIDADDDGRPTVEHDLAGVYDAHGVRVGYEALAMREGCTVDALLDQLGAHLTEAYARCSPRPLMLPLTPTRLPPPPRVPTAEQFEADALTPFPWWTADAAPVATVRPPADAARPTVAMPGRRAAGGAL